MNSKPHAPKFPDEMPAELFGANNYYRNAFVADLCNFDAVEINYERTDDDDDDEPRGEWIINAEKGGRSFVARHTEFVNALWFILEHEKAESTRDFDEWRERRKAALAKLTPEDRDILGVGKFM